MTAPWRNALFALFVAGILAYGAAFAWYMLERFDLVNLLRDVNKDDSFYYFQIARNLAEGQFSTFDGGITRTNGYHPIWLFLITPFYWVFDKEAALFAIKAFEIMLIAGSAALIAVAARLAGMPWILLFVVLPTLYQHHSLFAGLEAAAALFTLGLFFLALCLYARDPARWRWALAAVALALPWVRLEYIAVSLAATGALCLVERSWQDRPPGAPIGARICSALSAGAVVPLLAGCTGILVYFAYNSLVFGSAVPMSAVSKQYWSQQEWESEGGYRLTQNFLDTLQVHAFDSELLVALEVCAYLLLVWWFARRSRSRVDWLLMVLVVGVFGPGGRSLGEICAKRSHHTSQMGRVPLVFRPGLSDDGVDRSSAMLCRHLPCSTFHQAAIASDGSCFALGDRCCRRDLPVCKGGLHLSVPVRGLEEQIK